MVTPIISKRRRGLKEVSDQRPRPAQNVQTRKEELCLLHETTKKLPNETENDREKIEG
jgi:hypothetical protein